jgi:hypothetical protein
MKDLFGVACSSLCILHCLALPILVAAGIPLLGLSVLQGETTHIALSVLVIIVAFWSFPFSWRQHKNVVPGALAIIGLCLLALTRVMPESAELALTIFAGVLFITAHLINRKMLQRDSDKTLPDSIGAS